MAWAIGSAGEVARLGRAAPASRVHRWDSDLQIVIPALAIGGAIVAGMALNIGPLTMVGALAAIVGGLLAPAVGLAVLVFMAPLQPPLVIPAGAFSTVLVGAIVLGCVYRLPIDRPRIRLAAPLALLLSFVLYVAVQQAPDMMAGYAGDRGHLVGVQFVQLLTGCGAVMAAAYVLNRRSPYPFLAMGLAAALLAAVLAFVASANPAVGPPFAGLMAHSTIAERAVGSFYNPNYFGQFEAYAVVTAAGLMLGVRSRRLRWVLLATAVLLGAALLLSMSRGAVIALSAGLVCLVFSRFRFRVAATVGIALLVAVLVLFPIYIQLRLEATHGSSVSEAYAALAVSDEGRLRAALAGPQLFLLSPVFGIGWGYYSSMTSQVLGPGSAIAAHNWYVNVLAEEGIVGIVIWALLLVSLVVALRPRPTFPRSIGFGVLGAYAMGSLFTGPPASFQTSALPILVIAAALVSNWDPPRRAGRTIAGEDVAPSLGP